MVSSSLPAYQQFRSNKNTFLLSSLSKKKGPNFPAQRGACSKLSSPSLALPIHSPFHIMHFTRPRAPVQRASPLLPFPPLPRRKTHNATCPGVFNPRVGLNTTIGVMRDSSASPTPSKGNRLSLSLSTTPRGGQWNSQMERSLYSFWM